MVSQTTFAGATAVKAISSHEYTANFEDDWCIGTVPNGGIVASTFLQVASAHFSSTLSAQYQPHTIALQSWGGKDTTPFPSLSFLRRTSTGPALFVVKDVKLGRQTSIIHITLSQSGREEAVAYLTNSNLSLETGVSYPTSFSPISSLPVSLPLLAKDEDPNWALKKDMPYSKFRKASDKLEFYFPRTGQNTKSISEQWTRFSSPSQKWSNISLGFISDMFPLPVDAYLYSSSPYEITTDTRAQENSRGAPAFWYPTLLLNLEVKKIVPEGTEWLYSRVESKVIKNGRMDIEVVVADEMGEVVAVSNHVALAVGAERNVAERRKEGSKI